MDAIQQDLVGREVYARDGDKIGQVKELAYDGEYVVVRRSFFSKIVVPVSALEVSGERLTIPLAASYLNNAPSIDTKYPLSDKDKGYLDRFYGRRKAA
jgi:sporulation protein YlmC with PRC-barrel domain